MEKFNALPLMDKCSVLHDHGMFVEAGKNGKSEYAIYSLEHIISAMQSCLQPDKTWVLLKSLQWKAGMWPTSSMSV
jgi:hypothetical protein